VKLKEYLPSFLESLRVRRLQRDELVRAATDPLPVVVSMTSIPARLGILHLTVRSLLDQTRKPERIVLWLHRDLRGTLPESLSGLEGPVFEIRYVDLECPHRKLIHSLTAFPDHAVVTCDDDMIYDPTWLERLYADHVRFPNSIIAHECRRIARASDGELLPYRRWPTVRVRGVDGKALVPTGYAGVLYPPGALPPEALDVELFMRLAPTADDLWFKAMSLLNGTGVRRSSAPSPKPRLIIGSQRVSLMRTNVREDSNRQQWQAICDHFGRRIDA
jgi:hypothetical protein